MSLNDARRHADHEAGARRIPRKTPIGHLFATWP
jgi:hypothetical protein